MTKSTQRSHPPKATVSSVTHEILIILWNRKIHYRVHKIPTPAHILTSVTLGHALPACFFSTHFNIILPSKSRSSKWFLSLNFGNQNAIYCSLFPRTRTYHVPDQLDLTTRKYFFEGYKSWILTSSNFLWFPLTLVYFPRTPPSVSSSIRETKFHTHTIITRKIIALCLCVFVCDTGRQCVYRMLLETPCSRYIITDVRNAVH